MHYIYILFSVVHMSLVKQCIFLCTLRSICYVRIKIITIFECILRFVLSYIIIQIIEYVFMFFLFF